MNFILVAVAFVIACATTPLAIYLARRYGVTTDSASPSHPAHTHTGVLPRWGGIPVMLGIIIPALFLVSTPLIRFVLLGALMTGIVGLIDDKYDLSPYSRFFLNIASAGIAVMGGLGIPFITNPFSTVITFSTFSFSFSVLGYSVNILWLSDILAILWIVWCMNMVNWSKGVDGQLPGFTAIAAFFLGLLALRFSRHEVAASVVAMLAFITSASYLGFLPWNFYPQRILAGYGAGSLAGYMLGVLSILAWGKLGMVLLLLILPLLDAVVIALRRMSKKQSPMRGDRTHFHHSLLALGWGRRRIAVFYWIVTAIMGIFALQVGPTQKIFGFLLIGGFVIAVVVWTYSFAQKLRT